MKLAVEYEVTTSFVIYIERDQAPTDHEDLLENITRDELANAPMDVHEIEWGHIKDAWRSSTPDNTYVWNAETGERVFAGNEL